MLMPSTVNKKVPMKRIVTACIVTIALSAPVGAIAQTHQTSEIEIDFVLAYDEIWNDRGSGAARDVSFWRPTPATGWYRVGHHVKLGHGFPTEATMVVKAKVGDSLAKPIDYAGIWNDSGSGADRDVSVWRPVCPNGYQALGDVANGSHAKPSIDEVRCVKASALEQAQPGAEIWNDSDSGADNDFGAWGIRAWALDDSYEYLSRGLFYGANSHSRPEESAVKVLWTIKVPASR